MIVKVKPIPHKPYLDILIPGHMYREKNGRELIFVGFGSYKRTPTRASYYWPKEDSYLYMKKDDLDKKIASGLLSTDLSNYNKSQIKTTTDFGSTVLASFNPRYLVEDMGEIFQPDEFRHKIIYDYSDYIKSGKVVQWEINTRDVL